MTDHKHFTTKSQIQSEWFRHPYELFTLKGYRLLEPPSGLEYALQVSPGDSVKFVVHSDVGKESHPVKWEVLSCPIDGKESDHRAGGADDAKVARAGGIDMLRADCSLTDLAKLAEADDAKVAAWVSSWGLLGFRLVGAVPPFLGGGWTAPTDLGERHGVHYEPVDLIKKAAREASAVTRLHAALKIEGPKENSARNIQNLLRIDPVFGDPSLQTFKVSMSIDRIHLGEFSMPKSAYAWKRLAVAMLGSLSERYLASEFRLRWTLSDKFTKLKTYWEIRSLLGGLYFKLGAEYREARKFCEVCGNPILAHRSTKKTCGDRCRQRKRRHQFQSGEPA